MQKKKLGSSESKQNYTCILICATRSSVGERDMQLYGRDDAGFCEEYGY